MSDGIDLVKLATALRAAARPAVSGSHTVPDLDERTERVAGALREIITRLPPDVLRDIADEVEVDSGGEALKLCNRYCL